MGPSAHAPQKALLYRDPSLPVYAGDAPGGNTVSVRRYRGDSRDWRRLRPEEVAQAFTDLQAALQPPRTPRLYTTPFRRDADTWRRFEGLLTAVAVGTLQACSEGSYWAPSFEDIVSTLCGKIRVPMSRLFTATVRPSIADVEEKSRLPFEAALHVDMNNAVLSACQEAAASGKTIPRVALVRLAPYGDARAAHPALAEHRGDAQLFLRTSYAQAAQEMSRHLHIDPIEALKTGAVVYTSDVTVLRKPLEEGATWLREEETTQFDVLLVGLQRNPRCDDQGQYVHIAEKASVVEAVDRIFAVAAANSVDVLVLPPLGVGGVGGCWHPAADMGDILRKAALAHRASVPKVCVCQEHATQLRQGEQDLFARALSHGREVPVHRELVPMAASPYIRPGWGSKDEAKATKPGRRSLSLGHRTVPAHSWLRGSGQLSSRDGETATLRLGGVGRVIASQ